MYENGTKMNRRRTIEIMRPEMSVGGFSRYDGTVEFYSRINALLRPEMILLDLGAGRGSSTEDNSTYRRNLQCFRGKVAQVIGADIDLVVAENVKIDQHVIIELDGRLPLNDNSIDIVLCDWIFEHIENPEFLVGEVRRVLKSDGWLCARTPNKWGLTAIAARLVPNSLHEIVLAWLQPHRKTKDVFPVLYKMNSRAALAKLFVASDWEFCVYGWNGDPAYHAESKMLWRFTGVLFRLLPESVSTTLHIFARKRKAPAIDVVASAVVPGGRSV